MVSKGSRTGFVVGRMMDSLLLSSPYASSFGGFVNFPVALWFGAGGVFTIAGMIGLASLLA